MIEKNNNNMYQKQQQQQQQNFIHNVLLNRFPPAPRAHMNFSTANNIRHMAHHHHQLQQIQNQQQQLQQLQRKQNQQQQHKQNSQKEESSSFSLPSLPPLPLPSTISLSPQEALTVEVSNKSDSKKDSVEEMNININIEEEKPSLVIKTEEEGSEIKQEGIKRTPPVIMPPSNKMTNEGNPMGKINVYPPANAMMMPMPGHMGMPAMANPFAFHMMQPKMAMVQPKMMPTMTTPPAPHPPGSKSVLFNCSYPECIARFQKSKRLYEHLRTVHKTDFKCPHCNKQNACMANFVSHVRIHTNEKPWVCPVENCKYKGRTKNHTKCHVIQNHGLQTLEIYDAFFMQDRTENSINLKRKLPMQIPASLLKRTKHIHNSMYGKMPGMPPGMAFPPGLMPMHPGAHIPPPPHSQIPMGMQLLNSNPMMAQIPRQMMMDGKKMQKPNQKTPEEAISDLLNFANQTLN